MTEAEPESETKRFDLTTPEGLATAIKWLELIGWKVVLLAVPGGPFIYAAYELWKLTSATGNEALKRQGEIAKEIIEAGARSGAKEIDITIDNFAGLKLEMPLEKGSITTTVGQQHKMKIKIVYK